MMTATKRANMKFKHREGRTIKSDNSGGDPMRRSISAFALISREVCGKTVWLAQWNRHWQCFNFVGGHQKVDESFRDCIIREIQEELHLYESVDVRVAEQAVASLAYSGWSLRAQQQTLYTTELFCVEIAKPQALDTIESDRANRWLTEHEILAKHTSDGLPISSTMERLLTRGRQWKNVVASASEGNDKPSELKGKQIMTEDRRLKSVAVAIVYDESAAKFLLIHNKRWHGYAFPMKQFESSNSLSPAELALAAIDERELSLDWPNATATPLDRVGECLHSESARQYTYYDYHVIGIDPAQPLTDEVTPDLRWFSYDELLDAQNVTESTKLIARSLLEDRQVAAAVITRAMDRGREFLVVQNRQHEYFFPATRLKLNASPADAVVRAMPMDLAFDGDLKVVDQELVETDRQSSRFGRRDTHFQTHLCLIDLPGLDLTSANNQLEQSLHSLQMAILGRPGPTEIRPYWSWLTADELRDRPDVSATIQPLISPTVQLAERNQ